MTTLGKRSCYQKESYQQHISQKELCKPSLQKERSREAPQQMLIHYFYTLLLYKLTSRSITNCFPNPLQFGKLYSFQEMCHFQTATSAVTFFEPQTNECLFSKYKVQGSLHISSSHDSPFSHTLTYTDLEEGTFYKQPM